MRFTAIVVTWNSATEVPGLIESAGRHLGDRCDFLFVDNASEDGTARVIRELSPESRLIELDRNVGFGPANNIGVQEAEADVVLLLNPDTVIVDGSLADLAEVAARQRALFGPRLLNEDGSVQISARQRLAGWEVAASALLPVSLMPRRMRKRCDPWRFEERLEVGWLSGACLMAQRDLLVEFGPFDERLLMYGEDGDLCIRAWAAGVPSISAADIARVVHLGGRSAEQGFSDVGLQRKVEARWWVAHERFGAVRATYDLAMQIVMHATRWLARRATGKPTEFHAAWLRGSLRVIRSGRPRSPEPLPSASSAEPVESGRR